MTMKVLVWATTFGADLWSFTKYLDQRPDVRVKVVMKKPEVYLSEPVSRLFPLEAKIVKQRAWRHVVGTPIFRPDVCIVDNHIPILSTASKGFVLWHGFGWKGPNDEKEFAWLHSSIKRVWGSGKKPNPNFRWQTFGPWDFTHRTEVSGFHPENCRVLGAASHDDLRVPLDRERIQPFYPFDVVGRKTVLIAPTWHYGEVFAHWGRDAELFTRLLDMLRDKEANVILRLHDSFRFEKPYIRFLEGLAKRYPNLLLKFKDASPDNFLDLQVADVLVTNFSSIANLYYATKKPTVHVYPVASADEAFMWRRLGALGVFKSEIENVRFIWKLDPEENGGLLARSFDDVMEQVERSLDDPTCCEEKVTAFLDKHMMGADGKTCERTWEALQELVST